MRKLLLQHSTSKYPMILRGKMGYDLGIAKNDQFRYLSVSVQGTDRRTRNSSTGQMNGEMANKWTDTQFKDTLNTLPLKRPNRMSAVTGRPMVDQSLQFLAS